MRTFLFILLLGGVVAGLIGGVAYPAHAQQEATYTPVFEEAECAFYEPYSIETDLTCGYLIVPEDRTNPDGDQVRLHVAIFRTRHENPYPDPIVYLEGGPGGSILESLEYVYQDLVAPFVERRDFVLFDQRGTGYSVPNLSCPESEGAGYNALTQYVLPSDQVEPHIAAIGRCHARLVEDGVNLSMYNSAASAADLDDLREVLGYEQWNLFGISYGTRLALTAMRDTPKGIRSVVLDSTYPPHVNLYEESAVNLDRAIGALFAGCLADEYCNTQYPALEEAYYKLVENLNTNPVTVSYYDYYNDETYEAVVSGEALIGLTFSMLYSEYSIASLPSLIFEARNGDYTTFAEYAGARSRAIDFAAVGMYYSVQCAEEVPFSTGESVVEAASAHPELLDFFNRHHRFGKAIVSICATWITPQANEVENAPVVSDIPTLILAGGYDPITPPNWGESTGEYLSNSFYFLFPHVGHGVSVADECPSEMMQAFLDDPIHEPDASCMEQMNSVYFY